MRRVDDMTPTIIRRESRGDRQAIVRLLSGLGDVLMPQDAEEPILAPPVRAAVFDWLGELNFRAELEEARLTPRTTALLFGPPGCGKTMLAHHVAARLGVPMLAVGAEHLHTGFVGGTEKNLQAIFAALDSLDGKAMLFLDEIDAIGTKRTSDSQAAGLSYNSTLTTLLRRLERSQAIVVAATNRPDALDSALFRRFSLHLDVALPGFEERWAIIRHYFTPFAPEDELVDELSLLTDGAAPSLLRQIVEAAKRAIVLAKPRRQTLASTAADAFARIVADVRPPPDVVSPPLWTTQGCAALAVFPWPPTKDTAP